MELNGSHCQENTDLMRDKGSIKVITTNFQVTYYYSRIYNIYRMEVQVLYTHKVSLPSGYYLLYIHICHFCEILTHL